MKILDVFLEKGKNKFFNKIKKLPKEFEWYLGIITDLKDESFIKEKCNIIEENSKNNIKLIEILQIDENSLLLFAMNPIPFNSNIKGIVKSIARYFELDFYTNKQFVNNFYETIQDNWGNQKFYVLKFDNKYIDLRNVVEE